MGIKIGTTEEKWKFDKNGRSAPRKKILLKLIKITDDSLVTGVDKCSNM